MNSSNKYSGETGKGYFIQRVASRSDYVQSLRASLFQDLADNNLVILDFGCGNGGVLRRISAARRIGVEISEDAAEIARAGGIEVVGAIDDLPVASVDAAISFHAIEHVDSPLTILQSLARVVKPGGRLRLIVPSEFPLLRAQRSWSPNADRHLYTWTPLLFGNLAERAGLASISTYVAPMPTRSRIVRALRFLPSFSRFVHLIISLRGNCLNVIMDATVVSSKFIHVDS